jgi:hypothetical protein
MCLNLTQGMDVSMHLFCLRCPVFWIKKLKVAKAQQEGYIANNNDNNNNPHDLRD